MRLSGKRALITGGTSGIGLATAELFIENGAKVVVTGRNPEAVKDLQERFGPDHLVVQSDVSDLQQIEKLMSLVKAKFGGLDVLFANAGVPGSAPVGKITEELYDRVFNTNVKGLLFTVQTALPLFSGEGSIILNASIAPRLGRAGTLLYAASKSAVRTMARNFAGELASRGIRCNAISPGPIDTPIWGRNNNNDPATLAAIKNSITPVVPLGRFGTAREIAQTVLFLASDEAKYIVAADIVVDGGVAEIRT